MHAPFLLHNMYVTLAPDPKRTNDKVNKTTNKMNKTRIEMLCIFMLLEEEENISIFAVLHTKPVALF